MKIFRIIICFLFILSCKKENVTLQFSEVNILRENATTIEINIPKALGESKISNNINVTLNNFVCSALHINVAEEKEVKIEESVKAFNTSYNNFNNLITTELNKELPVWEALIDGEVIYNDENIICIAMSSSINTGAANSNMVLKFFNFNPKVGNILSIEDLVNNMNDFKLLVRKYYEKEINSTFNNASNLLNNNAFKLPSTFGFSENGIIVLYDNFEVGTFEKEIVEFTIPYEVANAYLKI